jgi:hypothetical protein
MFLGAADDHRCGGRCSDRPPILLRNFADKHLVAIQRDVRTRGQNFEGTLGLFTGFKLAQSY